MKLKLYVNINSSRFLGWLIILISLNSLLNNQIIFVVFKAKCNFEIVEKATFFLANLQFLKS